MRTDWNALPKLLQVIHNTLSPRRAAGLRNPAGADLRAQVHRLHMRLAVGPGDVNLVQPLKLKHRHLRNEQCTVAKLGLSLDAPELAGPQHIARVGKGSRDTDGAGLRVHLAIDE